MHVQTDVAICHQTASMIRIADLSFPGASVGENGAVDAANIGRARLCSPVDRGHGACFATASRRQVSASALVLSGIHQTRLLSAASPVVVAIFQCGRVPRCGPPR
jgi:hypothetical protein